MSLDNIIHTSDFLNTLVYDLTTGEDDITTRVDGVIQKIEDNNFPISTDYGIPEALETSAGGIMASIRWYTSHPSEDNAIAVAELILELFISVDAYINAF